MHLQEARIRTEICKFTATYVFDISVFGQKSSKILWKEL